MNRTVIVDFNNFWSPSGGGVRRYHLERMKFYRDRTDTLLIFAEPDRKTYTEKVSDGLIIEHIKEFKFPGNWEYRFIWKEGDILPVLQKYSPDIIEVGSPYILPKAVSKACNKLSKVPILTAFWHADFPVTYVRRYFEKLHLPHLAKIFESLAFAYARSSFKQYSKIQASSYEVLARIKQNGFAQERLSWIPLGCNLNTFTPKARDENFALSIKGNDPERLSIFFPHRFCDEKGLTLFLDAYPLVCKALSKEPAVLFAGTGPDLPKVKAAAKKFPFIRYEGFIQSEQEMAKHYASVDLSLALSGWETFGLSILESLACGDALIAASTGAAAEHLKGSNAGVLLDDRTPEALARAIVAISKADKKQLKENALNYAKNFSWESCFTRQLSMYKTLLY